MKSKKKSENSFETGMAKLSEIAELLESGEMSLDESLSAFEEGVQLYRKMQEQLKSSRLRIETIMASSQEEITSVKESEDHGF